MGVDARPKLLSRLENCYPVIGACGNQLICERKTIIMSMSRRLLQYSAQSSEIYMLQACYT